MERIHLSETDWLNPLAVLRSCYLIYVGDESKGRRFVEAVLRVARSGA